jgi:hypothetical protein
VTAALAGGAVLVAVAVAVTVVVVYVPRRAGQHARLRLSKTDHAHTIAALQKAVRLHADLGAQLGVLAERIGDPK